jgi:hypothetical protein
MKLDISKAKAVTALGTTKATVGESPSLRAIPWAENCSGDVQWLLAKLLDDDCFSSHTYYINYFNLPKATRSIEMLYGRQKPGWRRFRCLAGLNDGRCY